MYTKLNNLDCQVPEVPEEMQKVQFVDFNNRIHDGIYLGHDLINHLFRDPKLKKTIKGKKWKPTTKQ